ncbi:pyrroline-5-carboxylate reductase 3-like isoform X3 [Tachypleus tridentatus]|uniref:pyrroline-5-carboxylate reductase 3-like isoform X3 n=1 Tax=Tachypleus tridentatus TaxID=6853 RepID=UPI003FCEFA40
MFVLEVWIHYIKIFHTTIHVLKVIYFLLTHSDVSSHLQKTVLKKTKILLLKDKMSIDLNKTSVGFIGAGHMAQALANGMLKAGLLKPNQIWASAPTTTNLETFKLLPEKTRVIRSMPNTPSLVQAGVCGYVRGTHATEEDGIMVSHLIGSVAMCELVPENLIDTVTGLSGSGPAYVYTVIQAMADGAVKMGLPRSLAVKFAAQTVLGGAKMVLETGQQPTVLRDEVCSPGGTTIYGVCALEEAGLRTGLLRAVEAATLRAKELGNVSTNTEK